MVIKRINIYCLITIIFATCALTCLNCVKKPIHKITPSIQDTHPTPLCPKCRSKENVIPIVYGLPGPELQEKAKRGEVILGGCVVTGNEPHWYCKVCKQRWYAE